MKQLVATILPIGAPLARRFGAFLGNDSGAVTVDWVVVAASVVGLGVGSVTVVRGGVTSLGSDVEESLVNAFVAGNAILASNFDATDGLTVTGWGHLAQGAFDGWTAMTGDTAFEVIRSGYAGVHNPTGTNMLDMGGSPGNLSMGRTLTDLAPGGQHQVSFWAADTQGNNQVDVYYGGVHIGSVQAGRSMSEYRFDITEGMGDGSNQLVLQETGRRDNVGTYIGDFAVR